MGIRTLIWILPMLLLACGARPAANARTAVEVKYFPAPVRPCLRETPPSAPTPPSCLLTTEPTCSEAQFNEYTTTLLDHRERGVSASHCVATS